MMVGRFKPHPFLGLFDAADPNLSCESRPETVTPKQALYLMNDAFVHEQSASLAKRVLAGASDDVARLHDLWKLAVGREPSGEESSEAAQFLGAYRERLGSTGTSRDAQVVGAWSAYARALLMSNEFLYVD